MPFSKRNWTWNEEVFAGLAILALIILGIGVWWYFFYDGKPVEEERVNISELQGEERAKAIADVAAELEADVQINGGPTIEERREAAREPAPVTGHEPTFEESQAWVLSQ